MSIIRVFIPGYWKDSFDLNMNKKWMLINGYRVRSQNICEFLLRP